MIPLPLQALVGFGIAGCIAGIHALRAEVRAINVPKLPAKFRRRGRHRKPWWRRLSTMERWALAIQNAQEQAEIYTEPDWLDVLRADGYDTARRLGPREGLGRYAHLRREELDSTHERFLRIVGPSVWGTPVDVDEWAEPELAEVSRG